MDKIWNRNPSKSNAKKKTMINLMAKINNFTKKSYFTYFDFNTPTLRRLITLTYFRYLFEFRSNFLPFTTLKHCEKRLPINSPVS